MTKTQRFEVSHAGVFVDSTPAHETVCDASDENRNRSMISRLLMLRICLPIEKSLVVHVGYPKKMNKTSCLRFGRSGVLVWLFGCWRNREIAVAKAPMSQAIQSGSLHEVANSPPRPQLFASGGRFSDGMSVTRRFVAGADQHIAHNALLSSES